MKYEAKFYEQEGELYFFLKKDSIADKIAAPFIFDGPATPRHIKEYAAQYKSFLVERAKERNIYDAVIAAALEA